MVRKVGKLKATNYIYPYSWRLWSLSIANVIAKNVVLANKVDRTQATAFKFGSNNHWASHQELEFRKFVRKQDIAYKNCP